MKVSDFFASLSALFTRASTNSGSEKAHPLLEANERQLSPRFNELDYARMAGKLTEIGKNALGGFDVAIEVLAHGCYSPNEDERALSAEWLQAAFKKHPTLVGELCSEVMRERDPFLNGGRELSIQRDFYFMPQIAEIVLVHEGGHGKLSATGERAKQILTQWEGQSGHLRFHPVRKEEPVQNPQVPMDWVRA